MNNNINVNMTPNPLDLQRLECSQFDTTPRQFQFTFRKITEQELIESGLSAKQMAIIWEMVE